MPELPEVETVRRGLAPHLEGARLTRVEQRRPDLRFPLPERFVERLTGATVQALERRAKYLRARLDTGETLVIHLGMTGRFLVEAPDPDLPGRFHHAAGEDPKHTHVVFHTDGGARIAFNDARRFGFMDLIPTDRLETHPWFAGLGPEPLGNGFDETGLAAAFGGRKQNVKVTLLDQRVVAGLGNIYVCEALYRARIDPRRPAGKIGPKELTRLVGAVRTVLEAAIRAGGSTLRDYRNADGDLGYFQHDFRVYGREGEPCPGAGCGVIERIVQGGRSTFFCPACQR
ncbi:MAG TPA: bifunctional DNA-formamidopyrimidine glycosylase/DNA-(apurinic or apyrimidinic site) lyase [Caulobacteraceae bacterium]|nr:bifunctional DNA-formamidopyrimidine glycosylase/DNA-(apurinic or apyrimidinic site) lyase [Caulobacteraceae bacterium]